MTLVVRVSALREEGGERLVDARCGSAGNGFAGATGAHGSGIAAGHHGDDALLVRRQVLSSRCLRDVAGLRHEVDVTETLPSVEVGGRNVAASYFACSLPAMRARVLEPLSVADAHTGDLQRSGKEQARL